MTKDQEERILTAARQLVAALNSCDEFVTIEHNRSARRMSLSDKPAWRHTIDVHFHRTQTVGDEHEAAWT